MQLPIPVPSSRKVIIIGPQSRITGPILIGRRF